MDSTSNHPTIILLEGEEDPHRTPVSGFNHIASLQYTIERTPSPPAPVYLEASVLRFTLRPQHRYSPNDVDIVRKDRISGVYLCDLLPEASSPVVIDEGELPAFPRNRKGRRVRIAVDWPGLDMSKMTDFQVYTKDDKRKTRQDLMIAVAQAVKKFHEKATGKRRWKLNAKVRVHPYEKVDYMGRPRAPQPVLPPSEVDFNDIRLLAIHAQRDYWYPVLGVDTLPKYHHTIGLVHPSPP
ncbi:hypothetical protein DL96DRAFT_1740216 [Flagelloscypha sp. PMI_526]|nr:hypothetical protein DL96DRAFT_1740216 [Flagelloscypha sp. PMI_526]